MASRILGLEGPVLIADTQGRNKDASQSQVSGSVELAQQTVHVPTYTYHCAIIGHGCRVATRDILPGEFPSTKDAVPTDTAHRHERYVYSSIDSAMFELGSGINILVAMVDVDKNDNGNDKALWENEID